MTLSWKPWVLVVALFGGTAWADRTITIDGLDPDWAGVPTCYTEVKGDRLQQIDLLRVCLENNNGAAAPAAGSLFTFFEAQSTWPNTAAWFGTLVDVDNNGS